MSVGSVFEMYLLQFGWQLYGIVWEVLVGTGLAYIPFVAVIIDNVIKPIESQEAKAAAVTSLRRVEIDIVSMIVVMMLAVSPSMPLYIGNVTATSACGTNKDMQSTSSTPWGSQFARMDGTEVVIPPWFYVLLSVTGGINDAIITSLPCEPDMRSIAHELSTASISDDVLRNDVSRFNSECYRPGIAWIRNKRVSEAQDSMESGDIQWVGSQFLIDNFYPNEWAKSPVENFAFDPTRKSDMGYYCESCPGAIRPAGGYPSCAEWWESEPNGLRKRLADEFPPHLYHRINHIMQDDQLKMHENAVIKNALKRDWTITGNLAPGQSKDQSWGEYFASLGTGFGGIIASVFIAPVLYGVKFAAPLFQSMLLMMVYMLLPLALLFGRFSWSTAMQASVFIFGVKFWTVIWTVLNMIDNQMLGTIKRMSGVEGLASITNEMVLLKTSFDLLILSFYIAAPMFFMQMLNWAGYKNSSVANQATTEGMGAGKQSGQTAVETGKSAIPGK